VNLILAIGIVAQSTVGVHVLQLYMPMYAVKQLPMPAASSFGVVVLNGGLQFLLSPVIGVTIFGGLAPTIVETFIRLTGNKLAPSYCVLIAAVLSGVSLAIVAMRMRRPRSV